jgi:hypothetical protein
MVTTQQVRDKMWYEAKQGMAYRLDLKKAVVITLQKLLSI